MTAGPILTFTCDPIQACTMDAEDIRDLRRWFRNAVRRSQQAGFDQICRYGAHGFGIFQHFLSCAANHRTDGYGGSLENRVRVIREGSEDARENSKDAMAICWTSGICRKGRRRLAPARRDSPHRRRRNIWCGRSGH